MLDYLPRSPQPAARSPQAGPYRQRFGLRYVPCLRRARAPMLLRMVVGRCFRDIRVVQRRNLGDVARGAAIDL